MAWPAHAHHIEADAEWGAGYGRPRAGFGLCTHLCIWSFMQMRGSWDITPLSLHPSFHPSIYLLILSSFPHSPLPPPLPPHSIHPLIIPVTSFISCSPSLPQFPHPLIPSISLSLSVLFQHSAFAPIIVSVFLLYHYSSIPS